MVVDEYYNDPHSVNLWSGYTRYCWNVSPNAWLQEINQTLTWYNHQWEERSPHYHSYWTPFGPTTRAAIQHREIMCRYGEARMVLDILQRHALDSNNPIIPIIAERLKDFHPELSSPTGYIKTSVLDFIAYAQGLSKVRPQNELNRNRNLRSGEDMEKRYETLLRSSTFQNAVKLNLRMAFTSKSTLNEPVGDKYSTSAWEYNAMIWTLVTGIECKTKKDFKLSCFQADEELDDFKRYATADDIIELSEDMKNFAPLSQPTLWQWEWYSALWKIQNSPHRLYGDSSMEKFTCNATFGRPINPYINIPWNKSPPLDEWVVAMQNPPLAKRDTSHYTNLHLKMARLIETTSAQYYYRHPIAFLAGLEIIPQPYITSWPALTVELPYSKRIKLFSTPYSLQPAKSINYITLEPLNFKKPLIGLSADATTKEDWEEQLEKIYADFTQYLDMDLEVALRDENGNLPRIDGRDDINYEDLNDNYPKIYRCLKLKLLLENEAGMGNKQGLCSHQESYRSDSGCGNAVLVFNDEEKQMHDSEGILFEDGEFYCQEHITNTYELEGYGDVDLGEYIPMDYAQEAAEEIAKDYY